MQRGDVGTCSDSYEAVLQGNLQLSEHTCSMLVNTLVGKVGITNYQLPTNNLSVVKSCIC